jgi:hypothetical protein
MYVEMSFNFFEHYGPLFLAKVRKTKTCWEWIGAKSVRNPKFTPVYYGVYTTKLPAKRRFYAHRFSYELHNGPIPKGLQIDHVCKNTLCVNPSHLEAVTPRVNVLRGNTTAAAHSKKTHCPKGHPYTGENLIQRIHRGMLVRECRECKRAHLRTYYAANKQKWVDRRLNQKSPPKLKK